MSTHSVDNHLQVLCTLGNSPHMRRDIYHTHLHRRLRHHRSGSDFQLLPAQCLDPSAFLCPIAIALLHANASLSLSWVHVRRKGRRVCLALLTRCCVLTPCSSSSNKPILIYFRPEIDLKDRDTITALNFASRKITQGIRVH